MCAEFDETNYFAKSVASADGRPGHMYSFDMWTAYNKDAAFDIS